MAVVAGGWSARRGRHARTISSGAATDGPIDLEALMFRVARGDKDAFAVLYDQLAPLVFGLCLRVLRSRAHAEEVAQEVFLDVWRKAARFDSNRGTVKAWVATMAHRRAIDVVRSEEASRRRSELVGARRDAPFDEVADAVESGADRQRVRSAMDRLTDVQRETVELAYFGGRTYREVAAVTGVPEGTVKTRMRSALIKLGDILGVEDG